MESFFESLYSPPVRFLFMHRYVCGSFSQVYNESKSIGPKLHGSSKLGSSRQNAPENHLKLYSAG